MICELINKAELPKVHRNNGDLLVWSNPIPGMKYIVAVDPCAGSDPAAIQVIDFSGEQCAEYRGWDDIRRVTGIAYALGVEYGTAQLVVEAGGYGDVMLQILEQELDYKNIYRDKDGRPGWRTNSKNRTAATSNMQRLILQERPKLFKSARLMQEWLMEDAIDDLTMAMIIAQAVRLGVQ